MNSYCRQSWTWNKRKLLLHFFGLKVQNSFLFPTSCGTSKSQTHPMVLQSLKDTPWGNAVTCKLFLWYYSHLQTIPVVLQSLTDTSYGTTISQRHSLWCYSHFQTSPVVDCVWSVMAHAQKPDFVFLQNRGVHLNRQGRQFSRLLAAEVCTSAVVMLDTACSEVMERVLATHSIRQFPLHFPSHVSSCAITFQLDYSGLQILLVVLQYARHFL